MTTLQEKTGHPAPQSASCGGTTGVGENASFSNSTATYPYQSCVNIESAKKEKVEDWEIAEENIEVKPEEIITPWTLDEAAPQRSQHLEEQAFLDTKIDIQEEQLIKNEAALEDIKRTRRRIKKACFGELVKRLSIVCDLCDDDSAQRAIKLNAKERFAAAVVLKKSLSIGLRPKKILLRKIPAQSCGRCFTKIVLFATRLKEKFEAYQPKRKLPQMEPPHGYECQCQDCQDQFGQLNLIVRGIEASQSSASTMESLPPQAPYETQQSHLLNLDVFHPSVHPYPNTCMGNLLNISISSTPQTCFGATSATPYSPYQSYSGYYQQSSSRSCGFQPTVIHSQEAVAETSSRDSTLPTMLEDFEKETRTDPDQPSVSGAHHQSHLEEPSTSRRTTKICGHCQKQFTHTGDFRKHLRKHTKEKPYACKQCDKSFSHTSNLHRHERSHTGDRPYKCEFCNKEFNRKDKLESHKKSKSCKSRRKDGRK